MFTGDLDFIIDVYYGCFQSQLLQQLKRLICDLCRLYNLPQHPDVEMLDQPLPAGPITQERKVGTKNVNKSFSFVCPNS